MAVLQNTYTENIGDAIAGQIANSVTCDVDSYVAEEVVGFGVGVQQGTAQNQAKKGSAANKFIGVTVKDPTRDPSEDDEYGIGAHVNVLWRGDIWVAVDAAVTVGSNVTINADTGAFSTKAAADQVGSPGDSNYAAAQLVLGAAARFMTAAAVDGLARLRLFGELPSA